MRKRMEQAAKKNMEREKNEDGLLYSEVNQNENSISTVSSNTIDRDKKNE